MSVPAPLRWWKMDGAGNAFVVLDGRDALPPDRAALASTLCRSGRGPGADGLLIVAPAGSGGLRVDYLNADGSPARFCGNGARCAALFGREVLGAGGDRLDLRFPGARVEADLSGAEITIAIPAPRVLGAPVELEAEAASTCGWLVDAGVLHLTAPEPPGRVLPLEAWAAALAAVRPDIVPRVNITLVRVSGARALRVRTLERGAGQTAACGSGALAAAAWAVGSGSIDATPVDVIPPSGQRLVVTLAEGRARLAGPARFVSRGEIRLPAT